MFTDDTQFCVSSFFLLDVRFAPFFLFIAFLRTPHNSVRCSFICAIFALLIAPKICASFFYLQKFFVVNFNIIILPPSLRAFPYCSNQLLSLHNKTSLAEGELGTHINKYRSLIMSLRFVCRLRNNTAQSLVLFIKLGVRCGRRLAAPHYE